MKLLRSRGRLKDIAKLFEEGFKQVVPLFFKRSFQ